MAFGEGDFVPSPRSGHTAVVFGEKMYIFGGILELTKELNDLCVFDFNTRKFNSNDSEGEAKHQDASPERVYDDEDRMEGSSPSPTRKRGGETGKSPARKSMRRQASPKKHHKGEGPQGQEAGEKKELASPTSMSMQNSFIIKNADDSFDTYYH